MITYKTLGANFFDEDGAAVANVIKGVCLHDDTKPTEDIGNGSLLIEMDTGDAYLYDADTEAWTKYEGTAVLLVAL